MEDQINSSSVKDEKKQLPNWSSMNLVSVTINDLLKCILSASQVDQSLQVEDQTYISNALEHAKIAKQFDLAGYLEMSIFHFRKAAKIIDSLYLLRRDKWQEYQILLAPFYYKVGDSLATYVELNTNEMNQLKPLVLPEDPEDLQDEQDKQDALEEEKHSPHDEEEEKKEDISEEPKIEEITPNAAAQVIPESNEMEDLTEDIFENFSLAIQIINDFLSGSALAGEEDQIGGGQKLTDEQKLERNKVLSALRIDCIVRRADYAKFYNDIENAKADYSEVIKLCHEFPEGNQRILGSAHFSLGKVHLDIGERKEALVQFEKVQSIQREILVNLLKTKGQKFEVETEKELDLKNLTAPSIFDDDQSKDLKLLLNEIQEFINECKDLEGIQPKLDEMKKEAEQKAEKGVDTSVPEGFGLPQKDAETFKPVVIKSKKRNAEQAGITPLEKENDKQRKLNE